MNLLLIERASRRINSTNITTRKSFVKIERGLNRKRSKFYSLQNSFLVLHKNAVERNRNIIVIRQPDSCDLSHFHWLENEHEWSKIGVPFESRNEGQKDTVGFRFGTRAGDEEGLGWGVSSLKSL